MAGKVLLLYLDGPLQSWGYQSRFDRRTSLSHPTRSGILGMLCAALGVDRADDEGLARLDGLRMTVHCLESEGLLTDFHTIGGGWDRKKNQRWISQKAEGGTGGTVVTGRDYLQGARFGVVLAGEAALLEELERALVDPRWGVWLGRKSCPPASPICQGRFPDEAAAVEHLRSIRQREGRASRPDRAPRRHIVEVDRFDEGTDTVRDRPVSFAQRRFAPRRIAEELN